MQTLRTWLPAMAGMTCLGLGAGLFSIYGFFVEPLSDEFNVGVATLNLAPVLLLLVPGIIAPFVGGLVDRIPIRRMLLGGTAFAMLSLLLVSRAPTLPLAALGFLCFALGFVFYGPLVINGLMVKLYPGKEGRALAIVAIGISVASVTLPPAVGIALEYFDWRSTLAVMSAMMAVVLWLWILLAVPADAGIALEESPRRLDREIYRQPEFWMVGIPLALALNVMVILTVCYPPLFSNRGFTAVQAGLFLSAGGVGGALGKLTMAAMADTLRTHTRWLVMGLLLLKLLGLVLLLNVQSTVFVVLAVAMTGCAGGALIPMHPYLNSRYFDADIIGQVNGAQAPLFLPLGLIGPPLAGYVFDQTGSYDKVLMGLIAVQALTLVFIFLLPRPRQ